MWMAITLASLLISVCQNLTNRDVTQMPGSEKQRVYDALNTTLDDFFRQAGPVFTVNEASKEIYAPVILQINVTANSNAFTISSGLPAAGTSYNAIADLVNQAIVIAGDGQVLNRVQSVSGSTGTLWRSYLGTTGVAQATLYTDAVTFQQSDFQVKQPPVYTGPSSYPVTWPLLEWNEANPWMSSILPEAPFLYYGRPLYYITGSHLPLDGTSPPYWYMRLWPLPGYLGNISYSIKGMPPVYTDADRINQRLVPVPDQYRGLIATLAQRDLLGSPLWNKACDTKMVLAQIQTAERKLGLNIAAASLNSSPRQFGTPRGF